LPPGGGEKAFPLMARRCLLSPNPRGPKGLMSFFSRDTGRASRAVKKFEGLWDGQTRFPSQRGLVYLLEGSWTALLFLRCPARLPSPGCAPLNCQFLEPRPSPPLSSRPPPLRLGGVSLVRFASKQPPSFMVFPRFPPTGCRCFPLPRILMNQFRSSGDVLCNLLPFV